MKHILGLILLVLPLAVLAQVTEGIPITRSIKIEEDGKQILFRVLTQKKEFKAEDSKIYYWFSDGKIKQNVGGFAGDLLHGKYEVFSKSGQLLKQGQFNYGVKVGTWKSWDDDGYLNRISKYVEGIKHGVELILIEGEKQTIPYKMGLIHGRKIIERTDTVITIRYRNGKEITKEPKKEKQSIFQWMKGKKDKEKDEPTRKQIPFQKD